MTTAPELVFVHIGEVMPSYIRPAVALAVRDAGLNVRLLCSAKAAGRVEDLCATTAIENFYDPTPFASARANISGDHRFRDGFWLRTTERYFVLSQFMRASGIDKLVHAELDSLTFSLDRFVEHLETSGERGLFLPFDHPTRAIASLIYVNNPSSLDALVHFAATTEPVRHDMELLANFARQSPQDVRRLPTMESLTAPASFNQGPCTAISAEQLGGIVDAASIGQWVGGIDPRNRGFGPHWNHFENEFTSRDALLSLQLDTSAIGLTARLGTERGLHLYNLHLHSKMHSQLQRRSQLRRLVHASRRTRRRLLGWDVRHNAAAARRTTRTTAHRLRRLLLQQVRVKTDR